MIAETRLHTVSWHYLIPWCCAKLLFVNHFRNMSIDRQKDPAKWSFQGILMTFFFSNISSLNPHQTYLHSYRFYRLPQSHSCSFAIILSMILVLIPPITISWGKAEKVAFVQTTIVVTLLHLGKEIDFSDCAVSARTKPALSSLSSLLFLKVVFPLIPWTLLSWRRHLLSVCL